jgi:cell division protein ZapA (FtsZ GTPase activity inhibitor)
VVSRRAPRPTVEVEIAGERHVLRSDASPEYTRAVAAHVDQTVRRVDATVLDPYRSAVLAALFITDELFRTRAELKALRAELDSRAQALAHTLERAAGEAAPTSETAPGPPEHAPEAAPPET